MGIGRLAAVVLLILLAAFAAANWGAFSAPTTLTLGFRDVQAPLGLLMLGVCALLVLGLGGLALWLHTRSLMEMRRQAKTAQSLRDLADKAEQSRVVQLQSSMEDGFQRLGAELAARIDLLEQNQSRHIAETANGLAAALAEFDQRISAGKHP